MKNINKVINDYNRNKISLEDLQEFLWGLSESSLEVLSEEKLVYYLHLK